MDKPVFEININSVNSIRIGRKSHNDIVLRDKSVSGEHCTLSRISSEDEYRWTVVDHGSTNGTYADGVRIVTSAALKATSILIITDYRFEFNGEKLSIYGLSENITVNIPVPEDGMTGKTESKPLEDISVNKTVISSNDITSTTSTEDKPEPAKNLKPAPPAPYPYFSRSPRLYERIPEGEIEIEAAPDTMAKPNMNWISIIFTSVGTMVVMALLGVIAGGIIMNPLYMLPMLFMSGLTAIINFIIQKSKYKKEQKLLKVKYTQYLAEKEKEIADAADVQKAICLRKDPVPTVCLNIVKKRSPELWNRTLYDDDAVSVRVGVSCAPFRMKINVPKNSFTLHEKQYQNNPQEIYDKYSVINGIPFTFNFRTCPTLGLVGDYREVSELVRSMVMQMAAHYSYDELKMVFVYNEKLGIDWDFVKWLPHVNDETGSLRYILCSKNNLKEILDPLTAELKSREPDNDSRFSMQGLSVPTPFYVFFVIDPSVVDGQDIVGYMLGNKPEYGTGTVIISQSVQALPRMVEAVMEINGQNSKFYYKNSANNITVFTPDTTDLSTAEDFARTIAPVRYAGGGSESGLPTYITFMDGYNIRKPEELDLIDYWDNARPEKTMSVPIGIRSNGEKFYFDINEKAHGPHGLVAGTTGSGKSEMIQSWIISMALQFSPQDVSFVLIDFKGTGLILPFLNLPHLAGKISDLDTSIDRNLVALEAELQRRKALFDAAGVSNISSYLELYHSGKVSEPLSYLFVVIDEYAEFKVNFPDFTAAIDALFRTGRTLGVHIILLTQNPGGVISGQSESNVRFRWCLKVASKMASKEILDHPDAAKITNPGRAYVRVGTDEVYEMIQSFYSGGKYDPDIAKENRKREAEVSLVDICGHRKKFEKKENEGGFKRRKVSEIDALVNYINDYTKRKNLPSARPIWTEKMPDILFADDLIKAYGTDTGNEIAPIVGMLDDPAAQKQYPFRLPLSENGHAVLYGAPGTGKSTFLYTMIYSLCHMYTPEQVNLYLMDFGSWNLGMFKDYPHVGAVANDNEEEKVMKTVQLMENLLNERKILFSGLGVGSIQAYNYSAREKLPYVFLVIDNFAPVTQLYPQLDEFFPRMVKEGGSYGVILISTSNTASGLGFKLQQNIRTNIALQMSDPSDYSSIVGRTGGLQPDGYPGRGLYREDRIMEFQTALPGNTREDNARSVAIRDDGKKMSASWHGKLPTPLPIIPEKVEFGLVKAASGLTIGILKTNISPLGIDFEKCHTLVVSGMKGAGKTNLLTCLARQAVQDSSDAEVVFYGCENNSIVSDRIVAMNDGAAFDDYMVKISDTLKSRKTSGEPIESQNKIYIIADDFFKFFEAISEDTANRLNALVQMGNGLRVYFIAAGSAEDFNKYRGMIPMVSKMSSTQVIIMGGSDIDHLITDITFPDEFRGVKLGKYEGYLITEKDILPFKAMDAS
ncbi:MAG: type VII secretion protein EssC [Lachnospiraceae bacterium]|nr:type VII secretion protein EssC [Lachnospiraceae bacterium]